tara:strand:- start:649 stop:1293 length:645 start_codon:yes stop_codon:yes gene_type:complete
MSLKEIGMICMTKFIFALLVLSSCSVIDYGQLPATIKDSISGKDIVIDDEFYNAQKYSFAKIRIGRSIVAIAVLASANKGKYLWISQDGVRIYTNNGRITKTSGLQYDVSTLDGTQHIKLSSFINFEPSKLYKRNTLLELSNPFAIISQDFTLFEKDIDSQYFNSMLYEEKFTSGKLSFDGVNRYWVDPKGRVIKTEQFIHPNLPKVVIEFYFK